MPSTNGSDYRHARNGSLNLQHQQQQQQQPQQQQQQTQSQNGHSSPMMSPMPSVASPAAGSAAVAAAHRFDGPRSPPSMSCHHSLSSSLFFVSLSRLSVTMSVLVSVLVSVYGTVQCLQTSTAAHDTLAL